MAVTMQESRRPLPIPFLFVGVGFIILGIAAYVLFSKPASRTPAALPTSTLLASYPDSQFPRVSLSDALAAYNAKTAIFVDVRGQDAYTVQHIPGALSIPLNELASQLSELPKRSWIITYCT